MPSNYLLKIGSNFYFRCRIPKDLIHHFHIKEIKKSLKTNSFKAAKVAVKAHIYQLERIFTLLRTGMLNEHQLQILLKRYKDGYLIGLETFRDKGYTAYDVAYAQAYGPDRIKWLDLNHDLQQLVRIFGLKDSVPDPDAAIAYYVKLIEACRREMATFLYNPSTRLVAKDFVVDNGLEVQLPPPEWFNENEKEWFDRPQAEFNQICRRVLQTQIDAFGVEIERLNGHHQNQYDVEVRARRPQLLLSQLVEEFCGWRQMEKPANAETQRRYKQHFTTMLQILGDRDVTEYSHQDLLNLKAKLFRWPSNVNKKAAYRGKTVAEILGMAVEEPLDKRTVNSNYMGKIVGLFSYAFRHGKIEKDITPHLVSSLTAAEKKARKRHPYNYEDLRKIFDQLPFDKEQPHLAWVPLIAAYSGARQGEICQLLITDIKCENDIWYMDITEEDDAGNVVKTVKNENSKRLVPLHPLIIDMGFLAFVAIRKEQGKINIFETKGNKPLTGQYYSKRFQPFNNKVIGDEKKVFHSFRHTVHNELKQKGVVPDLYHSITGHAPQHEMDWVYSHTAVLCSIDKFLCGGDLIC